MDSIFACQLFSGDYGWYGLRTYNQRIQTSILDSIVLNNGSFKPIGSLIPQFANSLTKFNFNILVFFVRIGFNYYFYFKSSNFECCYNTFFFETKLNLYALNDFYIYDSFAADFESYNYFN